MKMRRPILLIGLVSGDRGAVGRTKHRTRRTTACSGIVRDIDGKARVHEVEVCQRRGPSCHTISQSLSQSELP